MAEVRITPAAKTHLLDIWAYTEQTWGEARADAYLLEIEAVFRQLAAAPLLGRPRPEIREGFRSIPAGSHVIFHTVTPDKAYVNIIGVLHAKMDVASRL